MYELHREIVVAGGSASYEHNNISSYFNEARQLNYASFGHLQQVKKNFLSKMFCIFQINTVSWDGRLEGFTNNTLPVKEPSNCNALTVIQLKYLWPKCRQLPLLIVATNEGFLVRKLTRK